MPRPEQYAADMSIAVPTWIGAVATVGLLMGAGITAYFSYRAFRIAFEEFALATTARRIAQASHVFVTEDPRMWVNSGTNSVDGAGDIRPAPVTLRVKNNSGEPVYDVQFRWILHNGLQFRAYAYGHAMPGEELHDTQEFPERLGLSYQKKFGGEVTFRDAAGIRWLRTCNGELREDDPLETRASIRKRLRAPLI